MTIQKILIPTDFSAYAEAGIEVALTLAKSLKSEIFFLHIHDDAGKLGHVPLTRLPSSSTQEQDTAHIHTELYNLVARAEHLGLKATPLLINDKGNEKIEDYINALHIDLIIMGTHGGHGIREFIFGTNASYVMHHSAVPVLIVKQLVDKTEFNDVLFASDFHENVITPLSFIINIASVFNATVHLLYLSPLIGATQEDEAKAKIRELIQEFHTTNFTINYSQTNDEPLAIDQVAQKVGADLIAITTHHHEGLVRIFAHHVAEKLVTDEELPVLIIPEARESKVMA